MSDKPTEKQKKYYKSLKNRYSMKEDLANLRENLKGMTFSEKMEHLWEYYKFVVIILLILLVILFIILSGVKEKKKNYVAMGVGSNMSVSFAGREFLTGIMLKELSDGSKNDDVSYFESQFGDLSNTNEIEASYNAAYGVVALMAGDQCDYLIMGKVSLDFFINQDVFKDLREVFTEAELEAMKEQLIFLKESEEATESVPVAINIDGFDFTKACVETKGPIYLAFNVRSDSAKLRSIYGHICDYTRIMNGLEEESKAN